MLRCPSDVSFRLSSSSDESAVLYDLILKSITSRADPGAEVLHLSCDLGFIQVMVFFEVIGIQEARVSSPCFLGIVS